MALGFSAACTKTVLFLLSRLAEEEEEEEDDEEEDLTMLLPLEHSVASVKTHG